MTAHKRATTYDTTRPYRGTGSYVQSSRCRVRRTTPYEWRTSWGESYAGGGRKARMELPHCVPPGGGASGRWRGLHVENR